MATARDLELASSTPMRDVELSSRNAVATFEEIVISPLASSRPSDFDVGAIYDKPASGDADDVMIPVESHVPNMWSKDYIGLYCCYAIFGLLYGGSGTWLPFCEYVFKGSSNLCANTGNIGFFAWNFKLFFAILTDFYQPFGYRRKSWMLIGAGSTLFLTFLLAVIPTSSLTANSWLTIQFFIQFGVNFSDVPADGYSVELGQLESIEQRGQILVTGQKIQFLFCIIAGIIQAFLLNGVTTNADDCDIDFEHCWGWGMTVNQYYGFMFCILLVLSIPILFLKELDASHIPHRNGRQFLDDLWSTMQNVTTLYLTIYVLGISMFTYVYSNVNLYMQYYIIQLSNFQVQSKQQTKHVIVCSLTSFYLLLIVFAIDCILVDCILSFALYLMLHTYIHNRLVLILSPCILGYG